MAEKKLNVFDFVNEISFGKNDILSPDNEKEYVPFIVNKALSYHMDTLFFANEINKYHELSKSAQFQFYLSTLRPRKRFAKWVKRIDPEDVELVCNALNCNVQRAKEALEILTPSDLNALREEQSKGGLEGGRK